MHMTSTRRLWTHQRLIRRLNRTNSTMAKSKRKSASDDLQNITKKTKDRAIRTPLKIRGKLRCSVRVSSPCSTCDTSLVTVKRHKQVAFWLNDAVVCVGLDEPNGMTLMVLAPVHNTLQDAYMLQHIGTLSCIQAYPYAPFLLNHESIAKRQPLPF